MRLFLLRAIRRLLRELDIRIERKNHGALPTNYAGNGREPEIESFLRCVRLEGPGERPYFEMHFPRLLRTLGLVPTGARRALELGSYVYAAAALSRVLGYQDVRGAYYSATPGRDRKRLHIQGQPDFYCDIDLFDAERHVFPYPDNDFDVVLCCEVIEHLILDPMHLLFECHRIIAESGLLLITTPNGASLTSVMRSLHGSRNPQVFSAYPAAGNSDTPHVREYTARELADAVEAAGFEIESLFTERIRGFDEGAWVKELLEHEGFDTLLRGEQTYCLARRRSNMPLDRYPKWLYAG
ncbi:MAG: class I SAM-dependent methyltransferase [Bryobacteraceae bacterium]